MKALGVGAGLSVAGGTAAARTDDTDVRAQADDDEPGTVPDESGTGTVHEVRTVIGGPSSNPDRPADFYYQPTGLHVDPGDVIKFVFVTPDHNVVAYHPAYGMRRRVPIGVEAFSSPLLGWEASSIPGDMIDPPAEPMNGENGGTEDDGASGDDGGESNDDGEAEASGPVPDTWLHSFDTPGVYDLLCSPHEGFGMAMRVVVGDDPDAPFETEDPSALPEPRAGPVGLARVTLTDPALQPSAIVEAGAVEWQSLESVQSGSGTGGGSEGDDNGDDGNDSDTGDDGTGDGTGDGDTGGDE